MNKFIINFTLLFLLSASLTLAQISGSKKSNEKGLYIGASLLGTSWNMPDFNFDAESGGGIGLKIGYNFSTNWALYASLDGSAIDPDQGDDYAIGHFDLGAEGRIGNKSSKLRPFLRASYLGMSVQSNDPSGDIEINGTGFGLGGGLYYFATNNFSLELSYNHSWINVTEIKIGTSSATVDENAVTGRLKLGASYHF